MIRKIASLALLLAAAVVVFGAYVRLSGAGLGCPDWPGCYGKVSPEFAQAEIHSAQHTAPTGPVSMQKAWKEMTHRYIAGILGLLIAAIAVLSWLRWRAERVPPWLPFSLVGVVIFQALLGMWTVTRLLRPAVVSAHLLGGLTILALLTWLVQRESRTSRYAAGSRLALAARLGLVLLVAQIVLGGWVSTNYASLACLDFPTCHGSLVPHDMAFDHAFQIFRELGRTPEGDSLPLSALTAIHWSHRFGAAVVGTYLLLFALYLGKRSQMRGFAVALGLAVVLQISLGISNVIFGLPLAVAVAHNAVAALLIYLMVSINFRLRAVTSGAHMERIWHESLAA
ncbi:MAG TPA: COX15/CtaA family protein [Rhodocyclaceae bacterium]|nr:COX15/CtaA family protein [Rhodocyclaceae bacterium]